MDEENEELFLGFVMFQNDMEAIEKKYCQTYKDDPKLCKEYKLKEICDEYEREELKETNESSGDDLSSESEDESMDKDVEEIILNRLKMVRRNYERYYEQTQSYIPIEANTLPLIPDNATMEIDNTEENMPINDNQHAILLFNWQIQLTNNASVIVTGSRSIDRNEFWYTTKIEKRLQGDGRLLQSNAGSVYILKGDINIEGMKQQGFPSTVINSFLHGFPQNWQKIVKELCSMLKRVGTRSLKQCKTEQTMLSKVEQCCLEQSFAECDKPPLELEQSRLRKQEARENKTIQHEKSKYGHMATEFEERCFIEAEYTPSEPDERNYLEMGNKRNGKRNSGKEITSNTEKRITSGIELTSSSLNNAQTATSYFQDRSNIDENSNQVMNNIVKNAPIESPIMNEKESSSWSEYETEKLYIAMGQIRPNLPRFWSSVSRYVGTKSPSSCQSKFKELKMPGMAERKPKKTKQKETKETKQEKDSGLFKRMVTARKGTLKRKHQIRQFLDTQDDGYEDDIMDSTPFRNRQKKIKLPFDAGSLTAFFSLDSLDVGDMNDSQETATPNSSTSSGSDYLSPKMPTQADRERADTYIWKLQQREKKRPFTTTACNENKKRRFNHQTYPAIMNYNDIDIFNESNKSINEDSDEVSDYYWND